MAPSRRQLLASAAVAAIAAPLGFAESAMAAIVAPPLDRRKFQPHLNSQFRITAQGVVYKGTLATIADLPNSRPGHPNQFRLRFLLATKGPAQGTYTFRHPALGTLSLFVVPVGTARRHYDAVIISRM